jgi:hypothetical protein
LLSVIMPIRTGPMSLVPVLNHETLITGASRLRTPTPRSMRKKRLPHGMTRKTRSSRSEAMMTMPRNR